MATRARRPARATAEGRVRIAATNARFGAPEVTLGLISGWGGTQRGPRQVPWVVAANMILGGEMIDAEEVLRHSLVNAVVEPAALLDEAHTTASLVCKRGPPALQATKRAVQEILSLPHAEGIEREHELFLDLAYTRDIHEGIAAFSERRPPVFTGH